MVIAGRSMITLNLLIGLPWDSWLSQDQGRQFCLGEDISMVRNPQRVVYRTRAVTIDMSVFDVT